MPPCPQGSSCAADGWGCGWGEADAAGRRLEGVDEDWVDHGVDHRAGAAGTKDASWVTSKGGGGGGGGGGVSVADVGGREGRGQKDEGGAVMLERMCLFSGRHTR